MDVEIIHMMAEQMETTVQGSGVHMKSSPLQTLRDPAGNGIGLSVHTLPHARVWTRKATPVYPFPRCDIQLHTRVPVGTQRNPGLNTHGCVSTRLYRTPRAAENAAGVNSAQLEPPR